MTSSHSLRTFRSSKLWPAVAVVLCLAGAACSDGSKSPTVATVHSTATTAARATATTSSAKTPLEKAQAYSQCMRSNGVSNFPDPSETPNGSYGFRTQGVDPKSAAFQSASEKCDELVPGGWADTDKSLTAAQQQQWLDWAKCIRAHGVPDFADPTFSGEEVHITGEDTNSPKMRSAMDACTSRMPAAGGLGG
jgi:hypothetical protein